MGNNHVHVRVSSLYSFSYDKFPNSKKERAPQLILRSCEDHICCPINRKIQKESVLASWISYPPMFPHLTIQPEIKLKAAPSGGKRKEA